MVLEGVVTNVTNFGAFVDVGVKQDGLVHISHLSNRYISDPNRAVKLNQKVTVSTDDGKGGLKATEGTVIWISDKAEFTPKTIQTKDERANLVYAIKVSVKNEGAYKIGMYGEVKL